MKGAILFTDIKESSVLWRKFPKEMFAALKINDRRIKNAIEKNKGMIVKNIGDSVMAKFNNAANAVAAALQIQDNNFITVSGNMEIKLRIGIASGNFKKKIQIIQGYPLQDFFGHTVNVASRLESNVSPIGGFAIAFLDRKNDKKILRMIEDADFEMKEVNYKYKCPNKVNKINTECRLAEELRGVGEIKAFIVF